MRIGTASRSVNSAGRISGVADNPKNPYPLEPEPEELRHLLEECSRFVEEHVESLPRQPSFDVTGAGELAATFREAPPESGRSFPEILDRLRPAILKSFTTAGPG